MLFLNLDNKSESFHEPFLRQWQRASGCTERKAQCVRDWSDKTCCDASQDAGCCEQTCRSSRDEECNH